MSTTSQKICIEALSLPRKSRAEIAERILASLEEEAGPKAEKAWKAVIRRSRAEIRSGKANPVPAEEALRRAHAAIE